MSSNRGASILEISIAGAIVAASALAAATFFTSQTNTIRKLTRNTSCQAALDSQMSYIREKTAVAPGFEWKGLSSGDSGNAIKPGVSVMGDKWVEDDVRLADINATDIIGNAGAVRDLNTHLLSQGSVGLVASLFNQVPGITGGVDITTIHHKSVPTMTDNGVVPATYDKDNLQNFVTIISVNKINVGKGVLDPSVKSWAIPQGGDPNAVVSQQIGKYPANVDAKTGYRVNLKGTFTDATGAANSCETSEDFFYPIDLQPPNISVVINAFDAAVDSATLAPAAVITGGGIERNRMVCDQPSQKDKAAFRLEIGFKSSVPDHKVIDSSTVFLCRDISKQINPNYCGGYPQSAGAAMNGNHYDGIASNAPWVPCNEVTACGIHPTSFYFKRGTPGEIRYELNFDQTGAPPGTDGFWGCDIQVDVATVDAAGNFKRLTQDGPHPGYPGGSKAVGRYFQPVNNCYSCYKKKPFSFLAFALIVGGGVLTGGVATVVAGAALAAAAAAACATGAAGACKIGGYNFKFRSCGVAAGYSTTAGSKYYCKKNEAVFPDWYHPSTIGASCSTATWNYPIAHSPVTAPASTADKQSINDAFFDLPAGVSCKLTAVCNNGTWEDENGVSGGSAVFATCNNLMTAYSMDANYTNDTPICVEEKPFGTPGVISKSYYTTNFNSTFCSQGGKCNNWWPSNPGVCNDAAAGGTSVGCVEVNTGGKHPCFNTSSSHRNGSKRCELYPINAFNSTTYSNSAPYYYFAPYNNATDSTLTFCEDTTP